MKIALVSPYDYSVPGGVNNHLSHLANEFTRLGHDARILVPSSEQVTDERVINASSAIIPVPFAGSIARISLSPRTYRRTKRILQEGSYDVLHLHEPLMPTLPLAVLRHHDLVPQAICVGTFHSYRPVSRTYYYGAPIFRRFFKRLDGHIAVSETARQYHARYFPADYAVIPNGVDVELFGRPDARPVEEFADGRPNILFVGRLEKRKGLKTLLDALPRVRLDVPDARLIVAGAYDDLEMLPFLFHAQTLRLADVHFVGRVSDEELGRYYRTADVFCAPSTGMESFGLVLLEAMAAGAPIVASDIDGYRDVMDDGLQGVCVKPEDPGELAAALVSLLRDPARRREMGARGREKALRYAWPVIAARVLEYYYAVRERVMAASPGRATRASIQMGETVATTQEPKKRPATFSDWARTWGGKLLVPAATLLGKLGLTPNMLTLLGLVLTLGVAVVLALGYTSLGGWLFLLAGVFDALDGTLARLTNRKTRFGAFLDSTSDRYADAAILVGVMIPFLRAGQHTEVILAFVSIIGSVMVSYTRARAEGLGLECKVGLLTRFERFLIIAIALILNQVTPVLWLLAILTNLTALQRIVHVWRITRGNDQA